MTDCGRRGKRRYGDFDQRYRHKFEERFAGKTIVRVNISDAESVLTPL